MLQIKSGGAMAEPGGAQSLRLREAKKKWENNSHHLNNAKKIWRALCNGRRIDGGHRGIMDNAGFELLCR